MNIYNYNHFFYFYITAKLSGVTKAAKYLNTSQSSLSMQIKNLEDVLGVKLFRKVGRNVELTDIGQEVFNSCSRAFEIFQDIHRQVNDKSFSKRLRLSIGVSLDIERPFVADILALLTKKISKDERPHIELITLPTLNLLQSLRLGEIDFLMITSGVLDQDIKTLAELQFPVGIFAAKNQVELLRKNLRESTSGNRPSFALPSKLTSLRSEIDQYFVRKKIHPLCVFESNTLPAVIRATLDGLGATVLPSIYIQRELQLGKLIKLNQKPLWKHRVSLVSMNDLTPEKTQFAISAAETIQLQIEAQL